jgi:ComF family protein
MLNLLNVILPTPCVICSKLGAPLCKRCSENFQLNFRQIELSEVSGFAISDYSTEAASIINNLKEKGVTSLTPAIAAFAQAFWPEELNDAILVPVPSSLSNSKKRGFSHTSLIAKALVRQLPGLRTRELLKSKNKRRDQVGLSPGQRVENMQGAFRADLRGFHPNGRPLMLIDDVLTSGATMTEAITCLRGSGLEVASFFVFARAGELKPSVYKGERDTSTQSKME